MTTGKKSNGLEKRPRQPHFQAMFLKTDRESWSQTRLLEEAPDSRIKVCFCASACEDRHRKGCVMPCFPGGASGKEHTSQRRRPKRREFDPWVGNIPRRRAKQPTPVFLSGESHGQRSLASHSPQGHKGSDMTEVTLHVCTQKEGYLIGDGEL